MSKTDHRLNRLLEEAKATKVMAKSRKTNAISLRGNGITRLANTEDDPLSRTMSKIREYDKTHRQLEFKSNRGKDGRPKVLSLGSTVAPLRKGKLKFSSKKDKNGLVSWEVIFNWRTSRQPFTTQKLIYKAKASFESGNREALALKDRLIRAGSFKLEDVSILSVSREGTLSAYQSERGNNASDFLTSMTKKKG